ncbi:hypothetical protein BH18THE2_BH18THE2_28180 [soil metagenome]
MTFDTHDDGNDDSVFDARELEVEKEWRLGGHGIELKHPSPVLE